MATKPGPGGRFGNPPKPKPIKRKERYARLLPPVVESMHHMERKGGKGK